MELYNDSYKGRCLRRLKERSAPVSGWECVDMYDVNADRNVLAGNGASDATFICELCDCPKVRFVHVMRHEEFPEDIHVGCVCAGIMEGDVLAAKDRDREMENRSKRKGNYLRRVWKRYSNGNYRLRYKNRQITIISGGYGLSGFSVVCDGRISPKCEGRSITSFLDAVHTAFDVVDPPFKRSGYR